MGPADPPEGGRCPDLHRGSHPRDMALVGPQRRAAQRAAQVRAALHAVGTAADGCRHRRPDRATAADPDASARLTPTAHSGIGTMKILLLVLPVIAVALPPAG